MNKRVLRDCIRLFGALIFCWLYIPHICYYMLAGNKTIVSDLRRYTDQINVKMPLWLLFIYLLHNNRYFRTLFYFRIGPIWDLLISWYRPGDRYFSISKDTKIGEGLLMAHPYSTILNAESIGKNFYCLHCTTLGKTLKGRPIIGDNVTLGANVTIIGPISIGDNVTIGAGSVVVKNIPNNCVAVGNPAKVIKFIE